MTQFSKKITKLRKEKKLSQIELATSLNIQQSTLSTWETGKVVPLITEVIRLAKQLDTPAQKLVNLIIQDIVK